MNVLIVYAHPEPTSFCGAMKDVAAAALRESGHEVVISDLHAENFDPRAGRHDFVSIADAERFHYQTEQLHAAASGGFAPDLAREQERFSRADLVVMIFPLWWGGPPAILKGWIDRTLACGVAYVDGARFATGLHKSKRGLLGVSTGGTAERFSEEGVYGPIEKVLWPLRHLTFEYMGMTAPEPFVAYAAPRVDDASRARYLEDWRMRVLDAAGETARA
jgi:NAD(P)H dehydrogenase (quinone)